MLGEINGYPVDFVSLKRSLSSISLNSNKRAKTVTSLEIVETPLNNKLRDFSKVSSPLTLPQSEFLSIRKAPPPPSDDETFRLKPNTRRFSQTIGSLKNLARRSSMSKITLKSIPSDIRNKPLRPLDQIGSKEINHKKKSSVLNFLPKPYIINPFTIASSSRSKSKSNKLDPIKQPASQMNSYHSVSDHLTPETTIVLDDLSTMNSHDDISPTLRYILGDAQISLSDGELDIIIDKFNNDL